MIIALDYFTNNNNISGSQSPLQSTATTQVNKVEPKAYNGASSSRYTVHVWPWSTAYSEMESGRREENRRTRRKTQPSHLWRRVRESNPGHIGNLSFSI